jgi:type I restriction-modification system DNA methylase subunit
MDNMVILTTTMNSLTFHQHIINHLSLPSTVKTVLPLKPLSRDPDDEKTYRDLLEELISSSGWYKPTGSLGKPYPFPIVVWLSKKSYVDTEVGYAWDPSFVATKVRDILGLVDTKKDTYLLSIQFKADKLKSIVPNLTNFKFARPLFADNGNRRFAVYLDNTIAKNVYKDEWGLTVNLDKLRTKAALDINGAPERISSSIPLSHIGDSLNVEAVGWVNEDRGTNVAVDDDRAYVDRLLDGWTLANIKTHLLTIANKP